MRRVGAVVYDQGTFSMVTLLVSRPKASDAVHFAWRRSEWRFIRRLSGSITLARLRKEAVDDDEAEISGDAVAA